MQHFVLFLVSVFLILIYSFFNQQNKVETSTKPIVRVFSYSSFSSKYGPGPELKEKFEKNCECIVEYIESSDSNVLLQRLKFEGPSLGADVVVGFDQFDLQKALSEIRWRKLDFSQLELDEVVKPALSNDYFVPYDWGVMSFIGRKDDSLPTPNSLKDLTKSIYKKKFALQDPRTSSPGTQFLYWIRKSFSEEESKKTLTAILENAHSFSPSWTSSYSLFTKKQVNYVFSYITSPIYHVLNEKNSNYFAIPFKESHPIQFEFVAIPSDCRNCEKGEQFINLMISVEGQKIIMNKNYMFPILKEVKKGTLFEAIAGFEKYIKFEIPTSIEIDNLLKLWTNSRKGD